MATPPRLQVTGLPTQTSSEAASTTSPARGAEMRNFLQTRLQKNRAPPLVHTWDFWHDRQERTQPNSTTTTTTTQSHDSNGANKYEDRLEHLTSISDVKQFWSLFNNFDIHRLQLRDSIHLFHTPTKPVWEDPRNTHGGAWTFRVPKQQAEQFWKEICLMAIGEQLQQAVESERQRFRDDICGVSLSVRFNSMLVQVWNRDAGHKEGVEGILKCVMDGVSEDVKPKEGGYYYKAHAEHAGFKAVDVRPPADQPGRVQKNDERTGSPVPITQTVPGYGGEQGMMSLNAVLDKDVGS